MIIVICILPVNCLMVWSGHPGDGSPYKDCCNW